MDFRDKVVIVTGGGKGVGRGITECFLAAGANVMICGRSAPETPPRAAERTAVFTPCDVKDYAQIEACVDETVRQFGRLDVLVNNAGG
ncbi:MAG: SDR family NAD(P)-dependent oxidoreductase, partial [Halioglobus sp.]|nr:SDR family NAD(P)-dependent oxidoreductase [Halioglobus sp.]